ncbi:hypothetical protein ACQ86N_00100 [Puia sp. P3]|uniref:hypothetical protein n=1 Tax=Puia sp. P3 TaxID=3423952 RepID=UPI003D66A3D2
MEIVQLFFPYAVSVIVFIAVARFFLVYEKFNCHIFNYLELTDLTVNIAHELYGLTWFMFASISAYLCKDWLKEVLNGWSCNLLCIVSAMAAIVGLLYWSKRITSFWSHVIISGIIYSGICLFAFWIAKQHPKMDKQLLMIGMILSFSWLYSKSLCQYTVHELKNQHVSKGTKIVFKDGADPIVSDENIYYIGNTSKYAFVYNSAIKSSTAYPMSTIVSIENSRPHKKKGIFKKSRNQNG